MMLTRVPLTFAAALLVTLPSAHEAAAAKSDSCAHCHGTDGNSTASAYPSLAGQTKDYLYRQMKDFQAGRRKNPMMSPANAVLTDQDMQELAEFFASQVLNRGSSQRDPALVAQGKQLAEAAQCAACH